MDDVEILAEPIRISGETEPAWLGPPDSAQMVLDNRPQVVRAVELGIGGQFALELDGEVGDGGLILVSLGDAWTLVEVSRS